MILSDKEINILYDVLESLDKDCDVYDEYRKLLKEKFEQKENEDANI